MSKIVILGNSVSIKVRPPARTEGGMTYAEHLIAEGHTVVNRSRAASMINEAFRWFDEDVIAEHPDVVILQFGVVEACGRRHPRWLSNSVTRNKFFNRVVGSNYEFSTGLPRLRRLGLRLLNKVLNQVLSKAQVSWRWLSDDKFIECLKAMIEVSLKDTPARVLVMGISPCGERIQRYLPGSVENISKLNARMKEAIPGFPERVCFVDVSNIVEGSPISDMIPDGVHFSASAHRRVGRHLLELLKQGGDRTTVA